MEKRKRSPTTSKSNVEERTTSVELVERTEVEDLKQALKEKEDQLLRTLAEFDNYRKRLGKELDDIGKAGKRELLLGLLTIADSFERAFQSEALKADRPVYKGMVAIYKQLLQLLEQHQVIGFESVGYPFDPSLHEAVGTDTSHRFPEGSITKEVQKGYLWEGKVLRPAQVLVAKVHDPPSNLDDMA
ncbi:MAG: nucleotide exchange factor GrpE [Acidobacteria bacterium]|nr:MAG: nucleotide exchange factor GrpE [Acidobacteriota bacterium]